MSMKSEDGGHEESEVIYQREELSEGAIAAEVVASIETKSSKSIKRWLKKKLPKLLPKIFSKKRQEGAADQQPSSTSNTPAMESGMEQFWEDVSNMSNEKIQELVIEVLKEGKYKQEIVPIDIWDFGGQKDYYMTHQLFITSRGIFVLMFNGSHSIHQHMHDLGFLPGHYGKPTTAGNNAYV